MNKILTLLAFGLLATTSSALAQKVATVAPAKTGYSFDTPVGVIAADPAGKAVLDANLPGMTSHERFPEMAVKSLNQLRPILEQHFSAEQIAKTADDLAKLVVR